jgi:hypothetical protein
MFVAPAHLGQGTSIRPSGPMLRESNNERVTEVIET